MALISDLPNATPQKSDLMEIQNGQTSSNNSSVGQLMQLSASENLAPAYDANAGVYVVGDFVSYNGTLYQCNTAIATPEAFDATKWTAVKVTEISSGASVVQLTQAEYTALSTAEKMNGSIYKLTDKAVMLCLDEEYHPVKELTTAQYEALTSAEQNNGTIYIKTDAETTGEDIPVNTLTPDTSINSAINACFGRTASDIPYSQGVSVADKLDSVKIIKTGSAYYSNLKGGGWADRVTVTITFDTPMPNANYVAFTMINDAYNDFPFIRIYPFSRSTTGFTATCINQSGSTIAVGGSFDWVVIG